MKEVLNVGVIGLGNRGSNLLENCILPQPGVRVLAVCDNYEDRREKGVQLVTAAGQPAPRAAADYREVLAMPEIDGGLTGGASLKAEDFSGIIHF